MRPPAYQIAIVVALLVGIVIAALLVTRKVGKSLDSFLAERGLAKAGDCPAIQIDGRALEGVSCYRGAIAPSRPGVFFIGHFKQVGGYRRYLGVQLASAPASFGSLPPAYSHNDGGVTTIAWIMNATRDNAERVLDVVAQP